ncbi:tetratricopeptide repeat protein [Sorangium sp. So ce381]|uniref:tetratricopeptide repeat protein n=1 Tax=Sorangium sp. So ce381 TaxID=3133307 RepID=UPI003F5C9BB6
MPKPVRLFISSAPEDAALRAEVEVHLRPIERSGLIEVWHDDRIAAGGEPAAEARAQIEAAEVVVLLVSPAFLASDRHFDEEAARALARRAAGEVVVVPVPVRPCDWGWTEFGKLAPLPEGGRPVEGWPVRGEAWTEVVRGLRAVVEGVMSRRAAPGGRSALAAGLPPAELCIGRGLEVEAIVAALVREPPGRVLLLGAAGVGKSTVSLAVLHRPEVVARFGERRFFARLDAAPDAESAAVALAGALRVASGPDLWQRAMSFLAAGPAVLVLDNLETPWDGDDQPGTEALLAELAAVPGLSLVASVRGAGRPGRVTWNSPIDLRALRHAEAEAVFCAIAGEEHRSKPALSALLSLMEGIPLAIALLAHATHGNDLINLKDEWEARRTAVLERDGGARDRLRSWKASLELSIGSPRMTTGARRLLSVLAVLPDGIAQRDLAVLLPGMGPAAARALAQVGLAYFEGGRFKMLSPVREYVAAEYPPIVEDLGRAMDHYGDLTCTLGPVPGSRGGTEAAARLAPETANLDSVIRRGLTEVEAGRWIDAATALTNFARFSGHSASLPLGRALEVAQRTGDGRREALCAQSLGDVALSRSQHDEARARYQQALPLYRQVGDVFGEADCIKSLGDIALRRSQHDEARARYQQALPLYRQVGDVLGEADCIKSLGDIALRRSQHDEARARYQQALPLYRQVGDVLGEADCIKRLGNLALLRAQHDEARTRYQEVLPLYRQVGDVRGEANCIKSLGDIALKRSQHDEARARYQEALWLYRQVGAVLGEANCIQSLGHVARERSMHDEARARYQEALPLYRQVGSVLGEADCIKSVGDIALERSQHDEARARYQEVLPLYRQVGSVRGEANCIKSVGDIALERSQHDEARARYQEALPLYRQLGSVHGEANCIKSLGDIALERSQYDEARARYQEALPLYRQVGSVRGEADCIRRLGEIAQAHSDTSAARARYEEALALYQRIPEPCSIGRTHHRLATIAPDAVTQRQHVEVARSAWQRIDRIDLIARLDQDFPS